MFVLFWMCIGGAVSALGFGNDIRFVGFLVTAGLFAIAKVIQDGQAD